MGPLQVHLLDREPDSVIPNVASIDKSSDVPGAIKTEATEDQNVGDALDSLIKETLTDTEASRLSPSVGKKAIPDSQPQTEGQEVEQPIAVSIPWMDYLPSTSCDLTKRSFCRPVNGRALPALTTKVRESSKRRQRNPALSERLKFRAKRNNLRTF